MGKGYFHVIAGSLTLFICVSVQASTSYTYTALDATSLGAANTYAYGIDGSNIVGYYYGSAWHGFKYDGSSYTALDATSLGATRTIANGIDGSNIMGEYLDDNYGTHGFQATVVPLPQSAWMALTLLGGIGG